MSINKDRLEELFARYAGNNCTPEELQELFGYLGDMKEEELQIILDKHYKTVAPGSNAEAVDWDKMFATVVAAKPVRNMYWSKMVAAAVILLALTGLLYFWMQNQGTATPGEEGNNQLAVKQDVAPGGNKAVLVLSDGSRIVLDSVQNGMIARQGAMQVVKAQDGQIGYENGDQQKSSGAISYNSLVTPRGGQYRLTLPDGSRVWLNAASSIKYPTLFTGNERQVEITGEAYFEIAHNAAKPFKVFFAGRSGQVEVLGTHFNINTYDDEAIIKTTLLEGKVKMQYAKRSVLLQPGEQARYDRAAGEITVNNNANTEQAVAWKNGLFDFTDDAIPDIMRRLARWYDVEVEYTGKIPSGHYVGAIRRQVNISEVLHMLELTGGVQFTIDQQKIRVKSL